MDNQDTPNNLVSTCWVVVDEKKGVLPVIFLTEPQLGKFDIKHCMPTVFEAQRQLRLWFGNHFKPEIKKAA